MADKRQRLEAAGYSFEVAEEPVTAAGATARSFFRVTILQQGLVLGTRSEIDRERALARAYRFAERHHRGEDPQTAKPGEG